MIARALSILVLSIVPVSVGDSYAATGATDGRLGGTYTSFIERFGEPERLVGALGLEFSYPDARYLAVQFDTTEQSYDPGDPALLVTVSADRRQTMPADQRDPGDWSLRKAKEIASDLTPTDTVFGRLDDTVPGTRSVRCRSEALVERFGPATAGQCRVTYVASSDSTVSFLTLTFALGAVGTPAPTAAATDDCAGVVAWAEASADRLDAAQTILAPLAILSDDPGEAAAALRAMASDLDALVGEQRDADAPRAVATANYFLIAALTEFSAAVSLAADGLDASDQPTVDEAIADLDAADLRAADASAAIEAVVADCDLTTTAPGTPIAG